MLVRITIASKCILRSLRDVSVALMTLVLVVSGSANATTPIARGDVLRVEVLSAPELSREAAVDADGRITLPLLGTVTVEGQDTTAIREAIVAAFEAMGILTSPTVVVEVAKYRSIYVGGGVAQPGAIDYVPGITARQAIIAAGGFRTEAADLVTSPQEILAAFSQRRAVAYQLAQVVATIARLQAELEGSATLNETMPMPTTVSEADRSAILAAELKLLSDQRRMVATRDSHLSDVLELIALEIETLEEQADLQKAENSIHLDEIADARKLVERGLLPRPRLQQLLREHSQMNTTLLDIASFQARARQSAETVRFEAEEEAATRREALRVELREAHARYATLEAEIVALDLQIFAGGGDTQDRIQPRLVIYRTVNGVPQEISAKMDEPMQPGDVIEVFLQPNTEASLPVPNAGITPGNGAPGQ